MTSRFRCNSRNDFLLSIMNERNRGIFFGFCSIQNINPVYRNYYKKINYNYTLPKRNISNGHVVSLYKLIELKTILHIIVIVRFIIGFISIKIFITCKYNEISSNYIRIINIIIYIYIYKIELR